MRRRDLSGHSVSADCLKSRKAIARLRQCCGAVVLLRLQFSCASVFVGRPKQGRRRRTRPRLLCPFKTRHQSLAGSSSQTNLKSARADVPQEGVGGPLDRIWSLDQRLQVVMRQHGSGRSLPDGPCRVLERGHNLIGPRLSSACCKVTRHLHQMLSSLGRVADKDVPDLCGMNGVSVRPEPSL